MCNFDPDAPRAHPHFFDPDTGELRIARHGYNCLVYVDDVLLEAGEVCSTRSVNTWTVTVNGIPVEPVGPMVIDDDRKVMLWRFKTI
jgi:hypothetical protein